MDEFYEQLLEDLKGKILENHQSIRNFANQNGFSEFVLCKQFNGKQDISLANYCKICKALKILPTDGNLHSKYTGTLREYLTVTTIKSHTQSLKS